MTSTASTLVRQSPADGSRRRFGGRRAIGFAAVVFVGAFGLVDGVHPRTASAEPAAGFHERPTFDRLAPPLWDDLRDQRVGGRARRFELDDPAQAIDLSPWYHLSAVIGSNRVQVFEHNAPGRRASTSAISRGQDIAWHVARNLLGTTSGVARPGEMPDGARPRTGGAGGASAGLLYALADIDVLTPGPLAGGLRVAATGEIASDGSVMPVRLLDAKLAAARLAGADVFFAPDAPATAPEAAEFRSVDDMPTPDRAIGTWLDTADYEAAGRRSTGRADTAVVVRDVRQALAWLCGRTGRPSLCAIADSAAAAPIAEARPTTVSDGVIPDGADRVAGAR